MTRQSGAIRERVTWDDLVAVEILTTDEGPFCEDFYFLLHGRDGRGCAVPQAAAGDLLARLQQLPGFDNEAFIRACGSTENARFVCWRR